MTTITELEGEVLNATLDDHESLEQIYRSLSLDFSPEGYKPSDTQSFYWREKNNAHSLAEIADALATLAMRGLLEALNEAGEPIPTIDPSVIWKGWFRATDEARRLLAAEGRCEPRDPS